MIDKLSIVIPAFQEEHRLSKTLEETLAYFAQAMDITLEIIVVDDGSTDQTFDICAKARFTDVMLRCRQHDRNIGKGAAVRTGVQHARGELILVMDADGAVPIAEEAKLRQAIAAGADIACGSRGLPDSLNNRSKLRNIMGRAFAWLVRCVFRLPIRDTQCGFKMFTARAARLLFAASTEKGYLADIEVLLLAREAGFVIREVPVRYQDIPGSRVSLWKDSWKMLLGLGRLKLANMAPRPPLVTDGPAVWRQKVGSLGAAGLSSSKHISGSEGQQYTAQRTGDND